MMQNNIFTSQLSNLPSIILLFKWKHNLLQFNSPNTINNCFFLRLIIHNSNIIISSSIFCKHQMAILMQCFHFFKFIFNFGSIKLFGWFLSFLFSLFFVLQQNSTLIRVIAEIPIENKLCFSKKNLKKGAVAENQKKSSINKTDDLSSIYRNYIV